MLFAPVAVLASSFMVSNGIPTTISIASAALFSVAPVALVAYLTKGGPAFWLTKTAIRDNKSRRPASSLRCAVRNMVAWFPILVIHSLLGPFTFFSARNVNELTVEISLMGIYVSILILLQFSGMVYAIVKPRRGLQDLLAGTCLVRRTSEGGST